VKGKSMGILGRFKDIMASNIHSVFNKDEKHPELAIEKYLNQLRSDLGQVNSESEALRMEYQRAKRAVDENLDEQEKLDRYIIKSKQAGNTANARIYEGKLERVKGDGEVLQQKLDKTKFDMDSLSQMNDKLGADISALEAKLSEIKTNGAPIWVSLRFT
jgi:phage shock protein A